MIDVLPIISAWHTQLTDPERFFTAAGAVALACIAGVIAGPQYGSSNPLYWLFADKMLGGIGKRLDRPERKARDLVFRALILIVFGLALAAVLSDFFVQVVAKIPLYGVSEIFLLSLTLSAGSVWYALLRLYFALKEKKLAKGAYYTIACTARVNLNAGDDFGITRVGMGLAARLFDKGLVAPVFWYLLAGLPGAYIYAGLAVLAWRFGREGQGSLFGKTLMALEKLMGYVPNLLAGVIMALASALTPTSGLSRALLSLLYGENRAPYEEGGASLTAMAYGLDVSLGGAVQDIDGTPLKRAWVGAEKATAQLQARHLQRALYLSLMAHLLFLAGLMGGVIWAGGF